MDGDESRTQKFMFKFRSSKLAAEVGKICALSGSFSVPQLMDLTDILENYAVLYEKRNRIAHDEWWIWPGEPSRPLGAPADRTLVLREIRKDGREIHDADWSAEKLKNLAEEFEAIADELDRFSVIPGDETAETEA